MADVQFEEEEQVQNGVVPDEKSYPVRLLLKTRLVSTDRQAEIILLVLALGMIIFAIWNALPTSPRTVDGVPLPTDLILQN